MAKAGAKSGTAIRWVPTLAVRLRLMPAARQVQLAWGLAAAVVLAVMLALSFYVSLLMTFHSEETDARARLLRLTETKNALALEIAALESKAGTASAIPIQTATPGQGSLALETAVRRQAETAGVRITSLQPLTESGRPGTLILNTRIDSDYQSLAAFAAALRQGTPTIAIRTAEIQAPPGETRLTASLELAAAWQRAGP